MQSVDRRVEHCEPPACLAPNQFPTNDHSLQHSEDHFQPPTKHQHDQIYSNALPTAPCRPSHPYHQAEDGSRPSLSLSPSVLPPQWASSTTRKSTLPLSARHYTVCARTREYGQSWEMKCTSLVSGRGYGVRSIWYKGMWMCIFESRARGLRACVAFGLRGMGEERACSRRMSGA